MGGVIGVESSVGVGSLFWVELVVVSVFELVMSGLDKELVDVFEQFLMVFLMDQYMLFYVEDNLVNLLLVEQLIVWCSDLKLLIVIDGYLGVQLVCSYQLDVILMDINLFGISGFDVLKILQDDQEMVYILVIVLLVNVVLCDIEKGIWVGFFCYLIKLIKVEEFMDVFDVVLYYVVENGLKNGLEILKLDIE